MQQHLFTQANHFWVQNLNKNRGGKFKKGEEIKNTILNYYHREKFSTKKKTSQTFLFFFLSQIP
jgi:hypothetical protein